MSPFESEHPIKVAFYIRVSTEEQAKDGYGADMQLRGLQDMIKYKAEYFNWTHDTKYEYFDMGCTGADLNRPQYKRMMEDAKEWKIDIVAVWKIDRLSRNLSHLLGTFEIL
jgi:site-specific DNA recombinase